MNGQPPKDRLRTLEAQPEIRAAEDGGMPRLTGYMLRYNEWTEIDSHEGHFKERIAPGAVKKTLQENRGAIKILFNHGMDPQIGEKPIAPAALIDDERGLRYDEPEMFDTSYNRDLVPVLQSGELGSSFRFHVYEEAYDGRPKRSDHNPEGIPEVTVTEMRLFEGGPVVFPAYPGAEIGARAQSPVEQFFFEHLRQHPDLAEGELEELFERWAKKRGLVLPEHAVEVPSDEADSNPDKHPPRAEISHPRAGRALDTPISGTQPKRALDKSLKE